MGTWEGHISPGVAFYSFGTYWCFMYSRQFIMESFLKQSNSQRNKKNVRGTTQLEHLILL